MKYFTKQYPLPIVFSNIVNYFSAKRYIKGPSYYDATIKRLCAYGIQDTLYKHVYITKTLTKMHWS